MKWQKKGLCKKTTFPVIVIPHVVAVYVRFRKNPQDVILQNYNWKQNNIKKVYWKKPYKTKKEAN